ncbi:hypothetical protein M409DRAFT_30557 [Zasmidium cellare ATCC 36951]|uniref:3-hydroxyphenylacetate 6-hydroxylase n=1 Tax=Zasmidium cellare ATCC 36951 TaxID=1080233 RepID=A0A6A6BZK8_ZASCE|nr:uncharacterized protein M409DRAFT_30557 [Zasmidium cellare ATCC 36951]KAF2159022.1 hypothetical protein M409DRAFT_30557 [Zasmidium cellare ATCC 36951]
MELILASVLTPLQGLTAAFTLLLIYLIVNEIFRWRAENPGFNGPRGLPIAGNLLQLQVNAPEILRRWSEKYGDVYQIQLGNTPVLVVNTAAAAKELFAHQGHALNSRPTFYTFYKIVGKTSGITIGTSPISPELKQRRRAAASALNKRAVSGYSPLLHLETNLLVKDILDAGGSGSRQINPMPLVRRFALSVILTINWGTSITSDDKSLFEEITEVEAGIVSTRSVMENLQDFIPILRLNLFSVRSHQAQRWRERRDVYLNRLDSDLRQKIEKKVHRPCIQSNTIFDEAEKLAPKDLRIISTSMIQGGTGTISGTLSWALLFLSQNLEAQTKVQREIAAQFSNPVEVLRESATAGLDISGSLYLHALGMECLRYFTVLRLSLPRESSGDCTYQGRHIPAGSVVFLNAWACNRDAAVWEDPDEFRPERWQEQPEAPLFTYGMGYRMCAGTALANRELELVLLKILACFDILPGTGQKPDASPLTGSSNVKESGRFPRAYEVLFKVHDLEGMNSVFV